LISNDNCNFAASQEQKEAIMNKTTNQQDAIWDYFQNDKPESFDNSTPRLEFLLRSIKPGATVLDIGVGNGVLEKLAIEQGIDIFALDPSKRSIANLRTRYNMGAKAQMGYGQSIPFRDNFFDFVIMTEVLEHLSADICHQTLVEVVRVLKPGGYLIGTVPADEDLTIKEVICPECGNCFHRWGHLQSFSSQSLQELLGLYMQVETIQRKFFPNWRGINWKQKIIEAAKKLVFTMRLNTGEVIYVVYYFRAKKE
jgi:ubiquinone/menaquinone biosynthesis C-methylase UbiE